MSVNNNIVTVAVSQVQAPIPNKLQKKGAFISQGGTTTTPGTLTLLTEYADLADVLGSSHAISSLSWSGGTVTVGVSAHGLPIGNPLLITISGVTPTGYNGTFLATATTTTQFTYALASDPGADTVLGTYTLGSVAELTAMATTFFSQGNQQAVYVLELGPNDVDQGVADLASWISTNPGTIYSYLVPREWDGNADFIDLLGNFNATTAKTYFFVTTTLQNYGLYTALMKCVFALIEAPVYGKWARNALTSIASDADGLVTAATTTAHGVSPGDYFQITGVTPAAYNGYFLALPGTSGSTLFYQLQEDPSTDPVFSSGAFDGSTGNITIVTEDPHGLAPGDQITVVDATGTDDYAEADGVQTLVSGTTGSNLVYNIVAPKPAFSSGSYNTGTGEVTITTSAPHGMVVGQTIYVSGTTGTGDFASMDGTWTLSSGTTGSTLKFLIADSLTMTISGATLNRLQMTLTDATIEVGADVLGYLAQSLYSSDGVTATEFTNAAPFWVTLNYDPSSTNRITPTAFAYLFDVTPFPTAGNAALWNTLQTAGINIVGTGAEGGITNTILCWGTTKDGRDFTYWYSVDWVQITVDQNVANAVINGSNNPLNPLYYNQDGIDRLQQVIASTMASGVTFGLVLGQVSSTSFDTNEYVAKQSAGDFAGLTVVNAVPFVPYSRANPSDYRIGHYGGFSVIYTPTRGFISILISVVVTDFVAQ